MKDYKCDLVVVAGGPTGLATAVQAAEGGLKVIVCEKQAAVGGAANMGMGPLGIGTRYQRQQMNEITVEKAEGEKCERCWSISRSVGKNAAYPCLCDKCCKFFE